MTEPFEDAQHCERTLDPKHAAYFDERGIPIDFARKHGFFSVESTEAEELLDCEVGYDFTGIAMQSPTNGYTRIRVDDPEPDAPRYLSSKGVPVQLWASASFDYSSADVIYVTEAPAKAAKLLVHDLAAVGLGGVSTTLVKDEKGRSVLGPSWEVLGDLTGRQVMLVLDANRSYNMGVARAENRLGQALEFAGTDVRVVQLDIVVEELGPDDYIVREGLEAFKTLVESAVPFDLIARILDATDLAVLLEDLPWLTACAEATAATQSRIRTALRQRKFRTREFDRGLRELSQRDADGAFSEPTYEATDGRLVKYRDCAAPGQAVVHGGLKLNAERTRDMGNGIMSKEFMIEGISKDDVYLGIKAVTAAEMDSRTWVMEKFGSGIVIHGSPADVRAAIQCTAQDVRRTTLYGHVGWRAIGKKWVYLHGGGAIGGRAQVKLDGTLAQYTLPKGAVNPHEAAALLLKVKKLSSPDVGVILLAAIALSPLVEVLQPSVSYALIGPTGSYKTSLAGVVLSCYGTFEPSQMTESWESTPNAIEQTLFIAKDVPVVIDDLLRDSSGRRMATANQVIRKNANGASRGRMEADGSRRPDLPPRGLLLFTGEELPDAEQSNVARILAARPDKAKTNVSILTELQAKRDRLPHAIHDYIHYLAPRMDELRERLPKLVDRYRQDYQQPGRHGRVATALAEVRAGLLVFEEFLLDRGVLDEAGGQAFRTWGAEGLSVLAATQSAQTQAIDPVALAMDTLLTLEAQGRVTIERVSSISGRSHTRAELIGWRELGGTLALMKRPTYAAINLEFQRLGERFPISSNELWQRLLERGWLVASTGQRPTEHQVKLGGARRKVIRLRLPEDLTSAGAVSNDKAETPLPQSSNGDPASPWGDRGATVMAEDEDE